MDNIGLYIHIPYCKRKCLYCSFYSCVGESVDETLFLRLLSEIDEYKKDNITLDTVFIGGGTPSLLSEDQIERLFSKIKSTFSLSSPEISVELNPDSATESKLKLLRKVGVNRVSFGVQSFIDSELTAIGRLHDSAKAKATILAASKYFDNINVDIMIGLPNQTKESLKKTLNVLLSLPVTHCSVYSLILEEGTPLKKAVDNGLAVPDADETVDLYDFAYQTLAESGFSRYEISNFCLANHECRHNLNCWKFHSYIGIGPSAHSFYGDKRYSNVEDIGAYKKRAKPVVYPVENENSRMIEYIMLALRTTEGIDKNDFSSRFNRSFDELFADTLSKQEIERSCLNNSQRFCIKPEYFYISNSIIVDFLEQL